MQIHMRFRLLEAVIPMLIKEVIMNLVILDSTITGIGGLGGPFAWYA